MMMEVVVVLIEVLVDNDSGDFTPKYTNRYGGLTLLEQLKVKKDKIKRIFSLKSSKASPNARLLSSVYFEYLMIQCYVWCICPFPDISDCCHYLSYATFPPGATKRE